MGSRCRATARKLALVARTTADGVPAGRASQGLLSNRYKLWIEPDDTFELRERALRGYWLLKTRHAPLARLTDADPFVSGNLPITSNVRGRSVAMLTILDEPVTPTALILTILLALHMVRAAGSTPHVSRSA